MTINQITVALDKYGYPLNSWISPDEYGAIFLTHDTPCFLGKEYNRIKINTANNTLEIVLGGLNKEGTFTTRSGETNPANFIPDQVIDIREIAGFLGRMKMRGSLCWTK
jgi:hypothetical protein